MGITLLCALMLGADPSSKLADRLVPIATGHHGEVAIAVKHLLTGETYYLNANTAMPADALAALPVLIETYYQLNDGKLKLTDRITLRDEDKVPGPGVLAKHFSAGTTFSLRDAMHLMMAVSDATALNLLTERVGVENVNQRMEAWELKQTRVGPKGTGGTTTAREMAKLLQELQMSARFRPPLKQSILGHLRKNEDRDCFTRLLPADIGVGHKEGAECDAGFLLLPSGPVIVVVLTAKNEVDPRPGRGNAARLLCARVARAVWEHYHENDGK